MKMFKLKSHQSLIKSNSHPAFTIIEVVLVLAITGLIFLMVFIALPALQRSQRDTQRKNDLSRVVAAVNSYKTNNRGKLPTLSNGTVSFVEESHTSASSSLKFIENYLDGKDFTHPDGRPYRLFFNNPNIVGSRFIANAYKRSESDGSAEVAARSIYINYGYRCVTSGPFQKSGGESTFMVVMPLESGGDFCIDG